MLGKSKIAKEADQEVPRMPSATESKTHNASASYDPSARAANTKGQVPETADLVKLYAMPDKKDSIDAMQHGTKQEDTVRGGRIQDYTVGHLGTHKI